MQRAFVFVVCGASEHLNMLKESYEWLSARTKYPIFVVTDTKRNEYPIHYSNLIDINVDPSYSHHQASIYLKTSLHTILPANYLVAYLDSDVLAWSENVDKIFDQYVPPVTFAPDHCKLKQFSSYAVNCGCLDMFQNIRRKIEYEINLQDEYSQSKDVYIINQRRLLFNRIAYVKRNFYTKIFFYLRYFLSPYQFKLHDFILDKSTQLWYDSSGRVIMRNVNLKYIARKLELRWNLLKQEIQLPDGRPVFKDNCNHLKENIENKFAISIRKSNWQHWNGGVFLFNTGVNNFMQTWHELTKQIFSDPNWKIRDQGTLVATVWKLGMQNHPTLSKKWNLIIDYNTSGIFLQDNGCFTIQKNNIYPNFIHVYHHFGDTDWSLWNKILTFKPNQYI
ncbi:MAG: hypothetical protein N2167_09440 [Flavobacteriales bacterium]|nr:hypothetical protein [Flavobacteriales bacterium]